MEQKSNKFLKVAGILMIIGGAFGIIVGVIAVAGVGLLSNLASEVGVSVGGVIISTILMLLGAIIELVAGIVGVKNAAKPEKAQICIVLGIIVAVLSVGGNIWSSAATAAITETAFSLDFAGLITGLVLPALFLIGAFQSKNSM